MIDLEKLIWRDEELLMKSQPGMLIDNFTGVVNENPDGSCRIWFSNYIRSTSSMTCGYRDISADRKSFKDTIARHADIPQKDGLNIIGLPKDIDMTQPVWIKLPDGRERIYFWAHAHTKTNSICRFLAADSTDGINFRIEDWHCPCMYQPQDRAVSEKTLNEVSLPIYYRNGRIPPSPEEPEASKDMLMNDATNVYLLPDGTFELYSAEVIELPADAPEPRQKDPLLRIIQRRTSADGLHWSPPQRVICRDEKDPFDLQFYHLAVTYTEAGERIGLLGHYRSDPGTMDLEFCTSKDGIHWERQRRPAFPRAEGVLGLYPPNSLIPTANGGFRLYYTGNSVSHHYLEENDSSATGSESWVALATLLPQR